MTPSLVSACLSVSSLFPPSSVNILAFLGLVYCWLQSTKKLSENCQFFFCIRLSRLRILLLLSTNEPVVVNSYYLYDAKQQLFLMAMYQIVCAPFMKGHGLYMNKTSINLPPTPPHPPPVSLLLFNLSLDDKNNLHRFCDAILIIPWQNPQAIEIIIAIHNTSVP